MIQTMYTHLYPRNVLRLLVYVFSKGDSKLETKISPDLISALSAECPGCLTKMAGQLIPLIGMLQIDPEGFPPELENKPRIQKTTPP